MVRRVAVVGGGWAGIAAAVAATEAGHTVTLFEMAQHLGGRARRVDHGSTALALDNGQHILIGAYCETLSLMRRVGADPELLLRRLPLTLVDPVGNGLRMPRGEPVWAFARAVLCRRGWSLRERAQLLWTAMQWKHDGFDADANATVASATSMLSMRVRNTLIEPLCLAALNTPAELASARVFLRVLRDALFSGPGSADMLLPRVPLSALLPDPAARWLAASGSELRFATRANSLTSRNGNWDIDGECFDSIVLACSATEAGRLTQAIAPEWSRKAARIGYEPIITVYLQSRGTRLAQPMITLTSDSDAPAQFAFDLGAIDGGGSRDGVFAFVISGAGAWADRGLAPTASAVVRQAHTAFASTTWREPPEVLRTFVERRATFRCTPDLVRPPARIAVNLNAAGDYVEGPYPATLEGAVRSGLAAARDVPRA